MTDILRILHANNLSEYQQWLAAWEAWPQREIFAHPNYLQLYAKAGELDALCALLTTDAGTVLYPFLLRHLELEAFWDSNLAPLADITSPYGYGGAFVYGLGEIKALSSYFWQSFDAWAKQVGIISEFIRFSLFDESLLPYPELRHFDRYNVVRKLNLDEASLWMDFKHKVRKNINRARSHGLQIIHESAPLHFPEFLRIYTATMQRRNAANHYYFSQEFFENLHRGLVNQYRYFYAVQGDNFISTELVLISADSVYSFLGATDAAAFDLRPNELLKLEIMNWAREAGKSFFVLGGGAVAEDGIYQYKKAFAPAGDLPFYLGKRILQADLYASLVQRKASLGGQLSGKFFPAYRE